MKNKKPQPKLRDACMPGAMRFYLFDYSPKSEVRPSHFVIIPRNRGSGYISGYRHIN